MESTTLHFPGSQGHVLSARLDTPAGTPRAIALFAHCFTCSKDSKAAVYVGQALAARGIAVLRFDFTGIGVSEGEFSETGFSSNVEDLIAAAAYLRESHSAPRILIGHSLGGAAVLAAATRVPECAAVATIGAPFAPEHVAHLLGDARERIAAAGTAEVRIGGRPFRIGKRFFDDLSEQDPQRTIATLGRALLILHSPRDLIVDIDNAAKIFLAAKHPKSFVSLDDADHLLSRSADAAYAAEVVSAWASRFIDSGHDSAPPFEGVRVTEADADNFAQNVQLGRHQLRADEPVSAGGADSGPSPYDLLLAGLGACTAMTLRLYARQKKLPLEGVSVDLRHDKIHASDCADCETREGRVDRIQRTIRLDGPLDDAQRQRLLEIANRCPVHRTLHSEVSIPTRLAETETD